MDVVGLGALNFDYLYMVDKIAEGGREQIAKGLTEAPGGSAANTIAGLSRLGAHTAFIGTLGRDKEAEFISTDLKREKIDMSGIKREAGKTGTVIGFVDKKGERALYAYPGVNDTLSITKKQARLAKRARYIHISSFVGDGPLAATKKLIKDLKGTLVSFAPGMLYAKNYSRIKPIIKKSSILFLNKEETELITGATYKNETGADTVVVTLGKKGCLAISEKGIFEIPGYRSKAIDTTGAGDAFAAGFLYGQLMGKDTKTSAKVGNWTASRCIAKPGARDGLPRKVDLKRQFKSF
jgi:ribokinase